jgi:hypothetical protein
MALMDDQIPSASTTELVKEALEEAKELVRLEVELAKDEVRREVRDAKSSAIALAVAAMAGILLMATLVAVLVVAVGPVGGLIVAGALAVLGGVCAFAGYKMLPRKPLHDTRKRLERDVHGLKERMA